MRTPLDLASVDADLDEVRAHVSHGEAQYNPSALMALRVAEDLRAEVEHLRVQLAAAEAQHKATDPGQ